MSKTKWTVVAILVGTLMALHPLGRAILIFLWPFDPGHW